MFDDLIITAVSRLQRTYKNGVFPFQVQSKLPVVASEGYIRRNMERMWRDGKLIRLGGYGSRRGYLVIDAWEIIRQGVLPVPDLIQHQRVSRSMRFEFKRVDLKSVMEAREWVA